MLTVRAAVTPPVGLAMFATGVIFLVLPFVFPWAEWCPGTLVYQENVSLFTRHGPLISLLAGLITISVWVGGVVGFARRLLKRQGEDRSG